MQKADPAVLDYFSSEDMLVDPYAYFDEIREVGRVFRPAARDVLIVTGFEECRAVLAEEELFSAVIASAGPATILPFAPNGEDIRSQLQEHRHLVPLNDVITSLDGAEHHRARSILNKLFVPSRLKGNKEHMAELADEMVTGLVRQGRCEVIGEIATPFVTLVIADLLGVPHDDRPMFREALAQTSPLFDVNNPEVGNDTSGFLQMGGVFYAYIEDRRANPRDDILTQIAAATYPDGSSPHAAEMAKQVMVLFGAGQDTSAKLLGNALRYLCEDTDMQARLRREPFLIAPFIEEMMRVEGSTKMTSRVATRSTRLGGIDIPAGQILAVALAGANRDPLRFADPDLLKLDRPRASEHLGFGRGSHVCIGAPLARAEVRTCLENFLAKTSSISISEEHHGPAGARRFNYEPSYGMRGLIDLHIDLSPA